jgi:hypothetical protein
MTAILLLLQRYWKPLALVGSIIVIILLYRGQIRAAEGRGYDKAMIETSAAAAAAALVYQAEVDKAEAGLAKQIAGAVRQAEKETINVRRYYESRRVDAAVVCLPPDRVQAANDARSSILAGAASDGSATVPVVEPAGSPDG